MTADPLVVAVLSGGGAKAAAHLGALSALAAGGIVPGRYIATSMGAVIAAALAAGLSPEQVLDRLRGVRRSDVVQVSKISLLRGWLARALLRGEPLRETIARIVPARRFDELALPLTVTATDLETGAQVLFGDGGEDVPLVDALYAACALPVWYPAEHLAGRRLADGGLRGPVPLRVALRFPASRVVVIDVGPVLDPEPASGPERIPPLVRVWNDASRVLMAGLSELELDLWRATPGRPPLLYIQPRTERGATFAVQAFERYFHEGRVAAEAALTA